MLETTITKKILAKLNSIPGCKVKKRHATGMGESDVDIYGCNSGRAVFLEVKQPGKKATPRQEKFIRDWLAVGAAAGVVTSVEEAIFIVFGNSKKN